MPSTHCSCVARRRALVRPRSRRLERTATTDARMGARGDVHLSGLGRHPPSCTRSSSWAPVAPDGSLPCLATAARRWKCSNARWPSWMVTACVAALVAQPHGTFDSAAAAFPRDVIGDHVEVRPIDFDNTIQGRADARPRRVAGVLFNAQHLYHPRAPRPPLPVARRGDAIPPPAAVPAVSIRRLEPMERQVLRATISRCAWSTSALPSIACREACPARGARQHRGLLHRGGAAGARHFYYQHGCSSTSILPAHDCAHPGAAEPGTDRLACIRTSATHRPGIPFDLRRSCRRRIRARSWRPTTSVLVGARLPVHQDNASSSSASSADRSARTFCRIGAARFEETSARAS